METATQTNLPSIVDDKKAVVRPGLPLWQILETIESMERELTPTPEEMQNAGVALKAKVDGCKQFVDYCGSVSQMIGAMIDELKNAQEVVENKSKGIKDYVRDCMTRFQFERLSGNVYHARLQKNSAPRVSVFPQFEKPDSDLYRKYPDLVRRTYSWDLSALGKAIEAGNTSLKEIAAVERGQHVRFGVNKGGVE